MWWFVTTSSVCTGIQESQTPGLSKSEKGRPMKARSFFSSIAYIVAIAALSGCGEAPENDHGDGSAATDEQGAASSSGSDANGSETETNSGSDVDAEYAMARGDRA